MYTCTRLRCLFSTASVANRSPLKSAPPSSSPSTDVQTSFPDAPTASSVAHKEAAAARQARLISVLVPPPTCQGGAAETAEKEKQHQLVRKELVRILTAVRLDHPDRWYAQEVVAQLLLRGEKAAALVGWHCTFALHRTHDAAVLLPLQLALYDLVIEHESRAVRDTLLLVDLHLRAQATGPHTQTVLLLRRFLQSVSFLLEEGKGGEAGKDRNENTQAWQEAKDQWDTLYKVQSAERTAPTQRAALQWMHDVLSTGVLSDTFHLVSTTNPPATESRSSLLAADVPRATRQRFYAALLRYLFGAFGLPTPLPLDRTAPRKQHGTNAVEERLRPVHAATDKGAWAAALAALARADLPPLRTARKALRVCETAVPRGAGWAGALAVWRTNARHLGQKEVGRVFHLLAQAHRWAACLSLLQEVPEALQDDVVRAETAYALRASPGKADLVLELWAAWRCRAGDSAPPSPRLTAHVLQAGLYGSDATAAAACVLVRAAAAQRAHGAGAVPPGATLPLDFVQEEERIARLLRDRWRTESWQAALGVALAHPTGNLLATVAQQSPLRYAVYEATTEAARAGGLELPAAQRHAVARHYATARIASHAAEAEESARHRPGSTSAFAMRRKKGAAREVELVTQILDDMLGKE